MRIRQTTLFGPWCKKPGLMGELHVECQDASCDEPATDWYGAFAVCPKHFEAREKQYGF